MMKFKKVYNLRTISVTISLVFFLCAATYGLNCPKTSHLRVPIGSYSRVDEGELHLLLSNLKDKFGIGDDWNEILLNFAKAIGKDRLINISSQNLDKDNLKKYIENLLTYGDLVKEIESIVDARDEDVLNLARRFIVRSAYRVYLNNSIDIKPYPVSETALLRNLLIKLADKPEFLGDFNTLKRIVDIFGFMYNYDNLKNLAYIDSTGKVNVLMHAAWNASEYLNDVLMPDSNIVGTIRHSVHRRCNARETLNLVKNYIYFIDTGDSEKLFSGADWPKPVDFDLRDRYIKKDKQAVHAYDTLVEIEKELSALVDIASQEKLELLNIWLANTEIKDDDFMRYVVTFAKRITENHGADILRLISDFRIDLKEKIGSAKGITRLELLELDYAVRKVLLYTMGDFYDSLEKRSKEGNLELSDLLTAVYDLGMILDCDYASPKSMTELSAALSDPHYNTPLELQDICKFIRKQYEVTIETMSYNYKPFIIELGIEESLVDKLFRQLGRQEFDLDIFIHVVSLLEKRIFSMSKDEADSLKDIPSSSFMQLEEARGLHYKGRLYLRRLYGGKAASLVTMANLGLPVPQAFFIPPIKDYDKQEIMGKLKSNVSILEGVIHEQEGKSLRFGDVKNPLLVSVRSGSFVSFPGAMNTIPFVGINDEIAESIAKETGNTWFAYDSYRRFLEAYGIDILGMDFKIFDEIIGAKKLKYNVQHKDNLSDYAMKNLAFRYKGAIEAAGYKDELEKVLRDPYHALLIAVKNVGESWDSQEAIAHRRLAGISDDWGTAVIVQRMVFGNFKRETSAKKPISGTAVIFSNYKLKGAQEIKGEFYLNAYGGDIVGGLVKPQPLEHLKNFIDEKTYENLERNIGTLANEGRHPQEIEISIEKGRVWWLQCRDTDFFSKIGEYIPFNTIKAPILHGNGVSGGTFVGKVIFNSKDAISMYKKAKAEGLDGVILLLDEAKLPQVITLDELKIIGAFVSALGGPSSHLAQFTAIHNLTAVIGLSENLVIFKDDGYAETADGKVQIKEGDVLSIDGNPLSGKIYKGTIERIRLKGLIKKQLSSEVDSCS